ncbi:MULTISPECIES: hypothetical protein [Paenibacillus]|uniref:Uncharacterized protein n=1 Tax=Paenibacillus violae TaxID=3077234 RepID=A0ABU3RF45_9BACL|nr:MULTISPECIES: hypothetical protein [Paenibacillus]MDU0202883.1 hypothetical protein [Paenibacillus sp. PFR10]MEC0266047.1 hypothetical protein [Paenibacillus anseongense]
MPEQQHAPVLSVKDWMITILLMAIPIVNIVLLFVWAFSKNENPSKSNYAKASLIWAAIGLVLYLIFVVILFGTVMSSLNT